MKAQKQIEVHLIKKRNIKPIDVVQYNTGIQLVFTLVDCVIPANTSATLYVQKRSGKFVYQEKDITVSGNTVTIDLHNQALTEHGDTGYQVELKNGNDTVTTFAGIFRVEKSLKDSGATESKTVIAAFEAKTAEQIAEIEAAAQDQIAQIQNLHTTYATKNEAANAIKGNLSGAVVAADDVSPVEHNPIVKVHGKNLFPTSELLIDKGTAYGGIPVPFYGVPGKEYTVSANFEQLGTATKIGISLTTSDGRWLKEVYGDKTSGKLMVSFTYPAFYAEGGFVSIGFFSNILPQAAEGAKCQYSNIQVEEGKTATDYEPYLDPSTVTVRRCGKNLLPYPFFEKSKTMNGITFTDNGDGTVTVNGTATDSAYFLFYEGAMRLKGTYTLSGMSGGSGQTYFLQPKVDGVYGGGLVSGSRTYQFDGMVTQFLLNIVAGTTVANLKISPMLEQGDEATGFEKYNGTKHTPSADGTVSGITSLSPNMTILTDTAGVVVECEYIRDTNKALASYVLTAEAKADIAAVVEADMAEVLASLNDYAESLIGGDA